MDITKVKYFTKQHKIYENEINKEDITNTLDNTIQYYFDKYIKELPNIELFSITPINIKNSSDNIILFEITFKTGI